MIALSRGIPIVAQPSAIPFFLGNQLFINCCVITRFAESDNATINVATTANGIIPILGVIPYNTQRTARPIIITIAGNLTPIFEII